MSELRHHQRLLLRLRSGRSRQGLARRPAASLLLLLAALIALPLAAQDTRTEFTIESRLLESDLEAYTQARERENSAVSDFRRLSDEIHQTLVDPNVALSSLRELEARLSAARETAYLRSKETGAARIKMYDRMERLVQLAQAVERSDPATLAEPSDLGGLWQIELEPQGIYGLMKLVVEGQLATGSYRMSNGNRGSLRGTWSGGVLRLEAVHSELGSVANLEGGVDDADLVGRWNATVLGAGQIESGSWIAYRITDDTSLDLGE